MTVTDCREQAYAESVTPKVISEMVIAEVGACESCRIRPARWEVFLPPVVVPEFRVCTDCLPPAA